VSAQTPTSARSSGAPREKILDELVQSAAVNIPGVDFASVSLRAEDDTLLTLAATHPLATQIDRIQYDLHEGPCYAAVTDDRLVMIDDLASTGDFPRYAEQASGLGVGAQLAIQLTHDGEQAGLNLYARSAHAFDPSTVQLAEMFATHAASVLRYAEQIEQLGEALHTRTDIGIAIGILMERYGLDRTQSFAYLVRNSNQRNIKLRRLARDVIDGVVRP
jgi:ANTAR domain/GAF domain